MSADRLTPGQIALTAAFVGQVIFKRWAPHAVGPDAFDCWGLARLTQRTLGGIELPVVTADPDDVRAVIREIEHSPLRALWLDVDSPRHLDLVRMSHARRPHHIGVYLSVEGGGVLHCAKQFDTKGEWAPAKPAVAFSSLNALPMEGWGRLQFMRYQKVAP